MSIASTIAVSGMNAAALRLQVSPSNVANILTNGPLPGSLNAGNYPPAYAALRVDQVATAGGGTSAFVRTATPGTVPSYDPSAPYADGQGMVASPNVDLATELIQQMMTRIYFAANVQVVRADAGMMASLIDITA